MKTPAQRRTQAERSAATRTVILEAAIDCLCLHGYGATTTVLVAKTAGVSRGAMLHHFPTRRDLIFAAAELAIKRNRDFLDQSGSAVEHDRERYAKLPDRRWALALQPSSTALLEIIVGARSDVAVREGFADFGRRLASGRQRRLQDGATRAGVPFDAEQQAVSRAIAFAIRGMAIEKQLDERFDPEPVLDVLRKLKLDAMDRGGDAS